VELVPLDILLAQSDFCFIAHRAESRHTEPDQLLDHRKK